MVPSPVKRFNQQMFLAFSSDALARSSLFEPTCNFCSCPQGNRTKSRFCGFSIERNLRQNESQQPLSTPARYFGLTYLCVIPVLSTFSSLSVSSASFPVRTIFGTQQACQLPFYPFPFSRTPVLLVLVGDWRLSTPHSSRSTGS